MTMADDEKREQPKNPPPWKSVEEGRRKYAEAARMEALVESDFFDDADDDDAEREGDQTAERGRRG